MRDRGRESTHSPTYQKMFNNVKGIEDTASSFIITQEDRSPPRRTCTLTTECVCVCVCVLRRARVHCFTRLRHESQRRCQCKSSKLQQGGAGRQRHRALRSMSFNAWNSTNRISDWEIESHAELLIVTVLSDTTSWYQAGGGSCRCRGLIALTLSLPLSPCLSGGTVNNGLDHVTLCLRSLQLLDGFLNYSHFSVYHYSDMLKQAWCNKQDLITQPGNCNDWHR